MQRVTDKNYFMDPWLIANLDTGLHNISRDFDLVILISGSGLVRVGKSVLAQQVGYYCATKLGTPFSVQNVVFSGAELMKAAKDLPPNSVIIYDEARGELDSKKVMESVTKTLIDFLNECGYLNDVLIFCLPDFFDLPKYVACNRSDILLNVYRTSTPTKNREGKDVMRYDRGFFEFYNKDRKKKLFILGKKEYNDYGVGKPNFRGSFPSDDIIDKALYQEKKAAFVTRDRVTLRDAKAIQRMNMAVRVLCDLLGDDKALALLKIQGLDINKSSLNMIKNDYASKRRFINNQQVTI